MPSPKSYRKGSRTSPRRDLYAEVTNRIVDALEQGVAPWVRPWRSLGASGELRNGASGHAYSGVNVMLLGLEMQAKGYTDSRFVSFKQAKQLGGSVGKGQKGSLVIFWKPIRIQDTDDAGARIVKTIPFLRHYHVFNVGQCDGLRLPGRTLDDLPEPVRDAQCEAFIAGTEADIGHGGSVACYRPGPDDIRLPHPKAFKDAGAYYSTAFHELTHWSGHKSRCDRDLSGRFGADAYAAEELVAELGSAFLCQRLSVDGTLQHPEYVGNWLEVLRNDRRAIFTASSKARTACEFLIGAPEKPAGEMAAEKVAA